MYFILFHYYCCYYYYYYYYYYTLLLFACLSQLMVLFFGSLLAVYFHACQIVAICPTTLINDYELECGPMPNLMVALPNIGGALCSTPQSLADAH